LQHLDLLARLGDLQAPALFVVGGEDTATTPALMAQLAARAPGAELATIAGAGHLSVVEAPDRFARLVTGFLGAGSGP
jgi:3-oxoadipate enol-lactonase